MRKNYSKLILPFGADHAQSFDSEAALIDGFYAATGMHMRAVENRWIEGGVGLSASRLKLPGLDIIALAHTPLYMEIEGLAGMVVRIALDSQNISLYRGAAYRWGHGIGAVSLPALDGQQPLLRTFEQGASLTLMVDAERLTATAQAMAGEGVEVRSCFDSVVPKVSGSRLAGVSISDAMKSFVRYLDQWGDKPALIEKFGLVELCYRQLASLLCPPSARLGRGDIASDTWAHRNVVRLCEMMRERLDEELHLGDLEQMSGLSARALQYAFKSHFGCTPMQWIREQRLVLAREHLLRGNTSITEVALMCGFANHSAFASYYRRQYGELPSETLRRSK